MDQTFAVELVNVSKRFPGPSGAPTGEVVAVDDVTLRIGDGEFYSLLGPSGCGKTTSLRMIAGFEHPTEGEVYIHGKPMGLTPAYQRNTNMVFQSYALFPHMNIERNVGFGLEMKKVPKDEIQRRVNEALDMVRLSGYGSRKPSQLSGGQQQRVALARALVNRPEVLLLDEPLGALDLKLRKEMQLELKNLQKEVGITFVYVTHDQEEALTMSDRIAVMHQGRVLQEGSPTEIYERPSCRFVADFIGETNFFDGVVDEQGDGIVWVRVNGSMRVCAETNESFSPGSQVTVAVRPEKIRLLPEPARGNHNSFRCQVEQVVYVGTDTRFQVSLAESVRLMVREQNLISTPDPTAYYSGEESETYAVWLADAVRLLRD
ncbi:MAG: ABC transporter ATP-binding protein [Anaerolineae bacterium]|nr:ABC transporter ATP-binding protein [Anaerolineae bacterium]